MTFSGASLDVAEFVKDLLFNSKVDWQSITIIPREKFAGCCVRIVTDGLWDDIVLTRAQFYSLTPGNI